MRLVSKVIIWSCVFGLGACLNFSCSENKKKSKSSGAAPSSEDASQDKDSDDKTQTSTTTPIEGTRIAEESEPKPDPIRGILQGYVVDGFTDIRIDMEDREDQFYIRIGGEKIKPKFDEDEPGYFWFENVPVNETYTVYTRFEGALPVDFDFQITSHNYGSASNTGTADTSAANSGTAAQEEQAEGAALTTLSAGQKQQPLLNKNIQIFNKDQYGEQDFTFFVTYNGKAYDGATVRLLPIPATSPNLADIYNSEYLTARTTATATTNLEAITGDGDDATAGVAVFEAKDISVGAIYAYEVIPPLEDGLEVVKGEFVMGLTENGSGLDFREDVNLQRLDQPLAMLSCNTQYTKYSNKHKHELVYTFNQPIEHFNLDAIDASLGYEPNVVPEGGAVSLDLDEDNGNRPVINVTIDGHVLRITPEYDPDGARAQPQEDVDHNLRFTVATLMLRSTVGDAEPDRAGDNLANLLIENCDNFIFYGKEPE